MRNKQTNAIANKLAKLGDALAISKSETINHSLTDSPTDWQIEIGGDVLRNTSRLRHCTDIFSSLVSRDVSRNTILD